MHGRGSLAARGRPGGGSASGLWSVDRATSPAAGLAALPGESAGGWACGPAVATYLTWKTVKIRSTQSATGILYIAMTLVLFGELTAMVLSRGVGHPILAGEVAPSPFW